MKRLMPVLLLLLITLPGWSQRTIWTFGTARNVPVRQAEFGILHPLQIGVTETLEVSVSPVFALSFAPNIALKNRWYTTEDYFIASKHTFVMPTLLARLAGELANETFLFSGNEVFKSLAAIESLPYQFWFRNQGFFTYRTGSESLLTGKLGFAFGLTGRGDSLPAFDQPLFYPWSTALNRKFNWSVGVQADGNIYRQHNFSASLDFHSVGLGVDHLALIHKGYYIYNHSIRFAVLAGYRMMYATYLNPDIPFENPDYVPLKRFSIFPVIDLIWKINAKVEPTTDLFRR